MGEGLFECKLCNMTFDGDPALKKHKTECHGGAFECRKSSSCKGVFSTSDERNQHEAETPHYKCDTCDLPFFTHKDWLVHRDHDPNCKALICPVCEKDFRPLNKKDNTFTHHVLQCQNMRTFICDVCGKGFNLDTHLRKHKVSHTTMREQSKKLSILQNEYRGEARRINPRRFPCDQCSKSYTTNQKLKFHKLSAHSDNVRQYPCPYCPARLMNTWTLSKHVKVMHESCEKIEAHCEICGLGYASKAKAIYCRRLHPVGSTPGSAMSQAIDYVTSQPEYDNGQLLAIESNAE